MNVEFKEFAGTEAAADLLYSNPAYDDFFKFRTKGAMYLQVI